MDHSTRLSHRIDAVRRAWRRERLLGAIAALVAIACLLLLALGVVDRVYHLGAGWRLALLGATVAVIGGATTILTAPLRRHLSDERVALFVEERVPDLAGGLAAAVEAARAPHADPLRAELSAALAADCLARAERVHPWRLVDRRRLARRTAAGTVGLLTIGVVAAAHPGLVAHELARLLTPWADVPLDASEAAAALRKTEIAQTNAMLLAEQAGAQAPAAPTLTVEPGDTRVRRGGSLRVLVSADRVTATPSLLVRDSAGAWRSSAMAEEPGRPDAFVAELGDLGLDTVYAVAMGDVRTRDYSIGVYDAAELTRAVVTLRFPAYLETADRTQPAGPIDVVEGTVARVELEASSPLRDGRLTATGAEDAALAIDGRTATGAFTVATGGQWTIAATGVDGEPLGGVEGPWPLRARKDGPPRLELLYPQIDTVAHPMAEIAIAGRADDDVALREMRLLWTWGEEAPITVRQGCAGATSRLAEFTIALAERPVVRPGDSILFHVEAEDMKGQAVRSETYAITVGEIEIISHYGPPPHPVAEHPPEPIQLMTLIGAVRDLDARRSRLGGDELQRETRRLATFLVDKRRKP